MIRNIIIIFLCVSASSCNNSSTETPLITVIKLISAESVADFKAAKEYIDIDKVYSQASLNSPEEVWKKKVTFLYKLGQDKKFTNVFKYYEYVISEEVKNNNAVVTFSSKNTESNIARISYTLEYREKKWLIVKIDYLKSQFGPGCQNK